MKEDLFLNDKDVDAFLHAVSFMADVANGDTTQVDYFTDEEIEGFIVMCKFLFPLLQKIHEVRFGGYLNEQM